MAIIDRPWPGLESCGLLYRGPGPEAGPVPTVFGFALSGTMTLSGGAIAQPAELLAAQGVRVCSLDLPHHARGVDPHEALSAWARNLAMGIHPFESWGDLVGVCLEELAEEGMLGSLLFYGISRGALAAAWAASHVELPTGVQIAGLCAWAPLVRLARSEPFQSIAQQPNVQELDCCRWVERMVDIPLKVWIGNLDHRVGVSPAFEWVEQLAQAQAASGHRVCRSELVIRPSVGHQGHGTPPESFEEGVRWLTSFR
jgi:hypothetical protein